jgi:RimJ/RimL family protein N-acetyltransferase
VTRPPDPRLETPRLLLRPVQDADADAWWVAIWGDASVTRFLPPRGPIPRERMERVLARTAAHWQARGLGMWAVRERETGAFVGHCGLVVNEPPDVELVYALARAFQGRGLATEAAACVTAFAFGPAGLDALTALVFPENAASARVLAKLGFARDGDAERFGARLDRYRLRRPA